MHLIEPLERINYNLEREFGRLDNLPQWRVVWVNDMFENRLMTHTDSGMELVNPEVRQVKKYQHIKDRYVLERLVPVVGETDLVTPTSYEPAWTFEDRFGNYLPPIYLACRFIIEGIYNQMNRDKYYKKYQDPNETEESRLETLINMEERLFGNETPVGDALAHGYGVTVPANPTNHQSETKQ